VEIHTRVEIYMCTYTRRLFGLGIVPWYTALAALNCEGCGLKFWQHCVFVVRSCAAHHSKIFVCGMVRAIWNFTVCGDGGAEEAAFCRVLCAKTAKTRSFVV